VWPEKGNGVSPGRPPPPPGSEYSAGVDLSVSFLGTGGPAPTALRNTAAVLVTRSGERMLFDCGEGTQRQLRLSTGLVHLDRVFLTHFHLDHCLGLPGLLKTYDLGDRQAPLHLIGPAGLGGLIRDFRPLIGRLGFELEVEELEPGEVLSGDEYEIEAFAVDHRTRALGYALLEDDRPGRFDPDAATGLGVEPGPDFGRLQAGEAVRGRDGTVSPEQVMGEDRAGRAIAITGDTMPTSSTVRAAAEADLLIHDASFMNEDAERARETGHSTGAQAAGVAAEADVKMLAMVHISARYHVGKALDEAREVFPNSVAPRDFDLIELPFPERGEPRLVRGGARRDGDETDAAPGPPGA